MMDTCELAKQRRHEKGEGGGRGGESERAREKCRISHTQKPDRFPKPPPPHRPRFAPTQTPCLPPSSAAVATSPPPPESGGNLHRRRRRRRRPRHHPRHRQAASIDPARDLPRPRGNAVVIVVVVVVVVVIPLLLSRKRRRRRSRVLHPILPRRGRPRPPSAPPPPPRPPPPPPCRRRSGRARYSRSLSLRLDYRVEGSMLFTIS